MCSFPSFLVFSLVTTNQKKKENKNQYDNEIEIS